MSTARDLMKVAIEQARFEGLTDREIQAAFDDELWEEQRAQMHHGTGMFSSGSMNFGWPLSPRRC